MLVRSADQDARAQVPVAPQGDQDLAAALTPHAFHEDIEIGDPDHGRDQPDDRLHDGGVLQDPVPHTPERSPPGIGCVLREWVGRMALGGLGSWAWNQPGQQHRGREVRQKRAHELKSQDHGNKDM